MKTIPRRDEITVEVNCNDVIIVTQVDATGEEHCIHIHVEDAIRLADAIRDEATNYRKPFYPIDSRTQLAQG